MTSINRPCGRISSALGALVILLLPAEILSFAAGTDLVGILRVEKGGSPVLLAEATVIPLTSEAKQMGETLRDNRLTGRKLKVTGQFRKNGVFEVRDFFVLRGESQFKIIYFCEVCNITTFAPGDCLCCQQPTVPVEVELTDPRIYHEEIRKPPAGQE